VADARDVWITGIGLLTCLGEGLDANWQRLHEPSTADTTSFAPYVVHRAVKVDFDKQIPKEERPAPDGELAADGRLCGRSRAR
jgi:3-oxoacyl-[acyl-carrier-protein] synthase II